MVKPIGEGRCFESSRAARPWGFESLTIRLFPCSMKVVRPAVNRQVEVRFLLGEPISAYVSSGMTAACKTAQAWFDSMVGLVGPVV